ncbi:MAG: 2-dehydropantoate 2-reductase [Nitrospinae bacterium CG22_combo_CG10-13_8_21_14_all_47_10]|nr:MAG: 2-dehydropantoate 2-reductase [Nitrospinae bacterium CG22_combo_CG10-13_8_21_14_all_47_10]
MKVLVFGAGAVGLGLSSFLIQAGHHVHLVGKEETVSALKKNGLTRRGIFGQVCFSPQKFSASTTLDLTESFDFFLVCIKTFDTENVARQLRSECENYSPIILCQNGWGNAEIFTRYFPKSQIFNARVITGFTRPEPHVVDVTVHAQSVHLGSLFDGDCNQLQDLAMALNHGGLPSAVTSDISKDLWAKMLYNCALNALGAVLQVPYGHLGENENSRLLMERIIEEVFQVMHGLGYGSHWESAKAYLKEFYSRLLPSTYEHESSMLQDIRAGRQTEIEALNGVIVREGQRLKVDVSCNETIRNQILFLQNKPKPT